MLFWTGRAKTRKPAIVHRVADWCGGAYGFRIVCVDFVDAASNKSVMSESSLLIIPQAMRRRKDPLLIDKDAAASMRFAATPPQTTHIWESLSRCRTSTLRKDT